MDEAQVSYSVYAWEGDIMNKESFIKHVNEGAVPHIKNYCLYVKKKGGTVKLTNNDTDEVIEFSAIEEAFENGIVDGKRIKDIVERSEYADLFMTMLDDRGLNIIETTGSGKSRLRSLFRE